MPEGPLEFFAVDPEDPEPAALIAALDAELRELYPGDAVYGIRVDEFRRSGGVFLLAKVDGVTVATGAIRPIDGGDCEVKRMFVPKQYRGRGFSRSMLQELEAIARQRGYRKIRIETGNNQPQAIGLYESAGYRAIPCYGEYALDPTSVCFEKPIMER